MIYERTFRSLLKPVVENGIFRDKNQKQAVCENVSDVCIPFTDLNLCCISAGLKHFFKNKICEGTFLSPLSPIA